MIRSLLLVPDSLVHPIGGMGVQLRGILNGARAACRDLQFLVVGSNGERQDGENFVYVPHLTSPIVQGPSMYANNFVGFAQATYVDTALWLAQQGEPVDVVHAFDWSSAYAGMVVARRVGVPLVVTFQLSYAALLLETKPILQDEDVSLANTALAVETAMCREAAAVIHVSKAYQRFWSMLLPEQAGKMVVIPNGVEMPREPMPRPSFYHTDKFNLLYIGRTCVQKGSHLLLDAVERLPHGARLHWAGDENGGAPELWDSVQRARQMGKINLLGYLQGDEKAAALQHADAVIMPSTHEPFGIVALEAMACGTPLITTAVTGLGEFCGASNSIGIEPCVDGIVDGVRRAMQLSVTEKAALVAAGVNTSRQFRWDEIARQLSVVYESICPSARL